MEALCQTLDLRTLICPSLQALPHWTRLWTPCIPSFSQFVSNNSLHIVHIATRRFWDCLEIWLYCQLQELLRSNMGTFVKIPFLVFINHGKSYLCVLWYFKYERVLVDISFRFCDLGSEFVFLLTPVARDMLICYLPSASQMIT